MSYDGSPSQAESNRGNVQLRGCAPQSCWTRCPEASVHFGTWGRSGRASRNSKKWRRRTQNNNGPRRAPRPVVPSASRQPADELDDGGLPVAHITWPAATVLLSAAAGNDKHEVVTRTNRPTVTILDTFLAESVQKQDAGSSCSSRSVAADMMAWPNRRDRPCHHVRFKSWCQHFSSHSSLS